MDNSTVGGADAELEREPIEGEPFDGATVDKLADIADELEDVPVSPVEAAGIVGLIDALAGGNTACYVNTSGQGIDRIGVVTDGFTVRYLALTTSWKWLGPYTPPAPETWLKARGYVPAPRLTSDAEADDE